MMTPRNRFPRALAALLLAAGALAITASGNRAATAAAPQFVDVLISFRATPGPAEQALVRGLGGSVRHSYTIVPGMAASVPAAAVGALQRNPNVTAVEPDGVVHALGTWSQQELNNAWGVKHLEADVVWDGAGLPHNMGFGIGIAIVDTGSGPHTDLPAAGVYWDAFGGNGHDDHGHGSHVAGSALALANKAGVVGMAPQATLFSYKVLNSSGSGPWSGIIAALNHIVDWNVENSDNPIHVANFSLGAGSEPASLVKSAFDSAYASGVLLVAAAGNSGNPPGNNDSVGWPARYASVIAVAATDQSDKRARWSSTGPAVELAAPGVAITSTVPGGYATWSGTSMASPHVAGAAALVLASGAAGSAGDARQLLRDTATNLGSSNHYGFGLVNPVDAALGDHGNGDDPPGDDPPGDDPPGDDPPDDPDPPETGTLDAAISFDRDPAVYSLGDTVFITVTVTDDDGAGVSGATVAAHIVTASGRQYAGSAETNGGGSVTFQIKTKRPDGSGDYTVTASASKSGYEDSESAEGTFTVN